MVRASFRKIIRQQSAQRIRVKEVGDKEVSQNVLWHLDMEETRVRAEREDGTLAKDFWVYL